MAAVVAMGRELLETTYSLRNLQRYDVASLLIVTVLSLRHSEITILIARSLSFLTMSPISSIPPALPHSPRYLAATVLTYESGFFRLHT